VANELFCDLHRYPVPLCCGILGVSGALSLVDCVGVLWYLRVGPEYPGGSMMLEFVVTMVMILLSIVVLDWVNGKRP